MSTTVRIQATVEIEVGTWGDKGSIEALAKQTAREAKVTLAGLLRQGDRIISVDKIIFINHSMDYTPE